MERVEMGHEEWLLVESGVNMLHDEVRGLVAKGVPMDLLHDTEMALATVLGKIRGRVRVQDGA